MFIHRIIEERIMDNKIKVYQSALKFISEYNTDPIMA
jgi:hypothetical protein